MKKFFNLCWINHVRFGNTIGLRKAILLRRLRPVTVVQTTKG